MKFELVDPDDWDCGTSSGTAESGSGDDAAEEEPREAETPYPTARLQQATARLTSSVSTEAARAGQAVSGLLDRVARMERESAESGHGPVGRLPDTFRSDRFAAARPSATTTEHGAGTPGQE